MDFPQILNWRDVEGLGSEADNAQMDRIVCEHQAKIRAPLLCLEIGSYKGRSAVLFAQYGRTICIDLFGNVHHGERFPETIGENFGAFLETIKRFGLIGRVFPILSSSEFLTVIPPLNCDVIYVDADHSYAAAKADISRSLRHLRPEGLLLCHDYKTPGNPPHIGVNQAVDDLVADGEFGVLEHTGGLVCLQRGIGASTTAS